MPFYGGQAVIEGVMMRGSTHVAVAVRRPDGRISLRRKPINMWSARTKWRNVPLIRGTFALVEALVLGIEALMYSANEAVGEEGGKLGWGETALSLTLAFALAIGLFVVAPTLLAGFVRRAVPNPVMLNLLEGAVRLLILLGYIRSISLLGDVRRVLEYHGAEHKVINAHEAGKELSVNNARPHSILHPRCGTSFLLFVAVVSVFLFAFLGWPSVWLRAASRLALLPVVAGISYEFTRLAGRSRSGVSSLISRPGLWLQRMTAREPDDSQVEVAIAALSGLIEEENRGRDAAGPLGV